MIRPEDLDLAKIYWLPSFWDDWAKLYEGTNTQYDYYIGNDIRRGYILYNEGDYYWSPKTWEFG